MSSTAKLSQRQAPRRPSVIPNPLASESEWRRFTHRDLASPDHAGLAPTLADLMAEQRVLTTWLAQQQFQRRRPRVISISDHCLVTDQGWVADRLSRLGVCLRHQAARRVA